MTDTTLSPSTRLERSLRVDHDFYGKLKIVVAMLERYPCGITARHAAYDLGWKLGTTEQRLSRLAAYGFIRAEPIPNPAFHGPRFLYRPKANKKS